MLLRLLVVVLGVADAKDKEGLLLCSSRGLLKKMKIRPLVGDFVQVAKVDWVERRAVVHNILARQRESVDPPVANFTQLLTVFALTQPELDMYQVRFGCLMCKSSRTSYMLT